MILSLGKNHYTVESCNATVSGFLSYDISLVDFFLHFERHCLKVMDVLGSFGHVLFETLGDHCVLKRWTRVVNGAYATSVVSLPRTRGQEDEERYILLYAKFGQIVRAIYSEDSLYKYINIVAGHLIDRFGKGMDALAVLFSQRLVLTVPDPSLLVSTGEDGNVGIAPPSSTHSAPMDITRKYVRQPKPSKNSLLYKTNTRYIGGEPTTHGQRQLPVQPPWWKRPTQKLQKGASHSSLMVPIRPSHWMPSFLPNEVKGDEPNLVEVFRPIEGKIPQLQDRIKKIQAENAKLKKCFKHIDIDNVDVSSASTSF
ncbi:hypothetical protein LINGRAHAP2_LOCUS1959 [Linum grandiflorum]